MKYVWSTFVVIGLLGCLNEQPTRFDHTKIEPAEEEKPLRTVQNRHIWQRPDFVLDRLGDINDKTIADIGAGSGYFAFRFLKAGARVIAVDIDANMIELMESEVRLLPDSLANRFDARMTTPKSPGLEQEEADIVFIANTYTYLVDRASYLEDLLPCIRPGGELMIIDFKKKQTEIGPPMENRLALGQVEEELTQAGFEIIESDDTSLAFQYIIRAKK
jgi:ubiquinone/menaquinone biosynthesis C-methylase UbiE